MTGELDDAFEKFVEEHALDRYPRVGVVLSTSGAGATHEWSRYRGGVFSHEVRSALTGAADANEDGRVDYDELEAFLAAANLSMPVPKGRPRVFVRPPKIDRAAPLLTMERGLPVLTLPDQVTGHYYLEDDRGLRYAELNKAEGHAMKLRLIPRAKYLLMRSDGAEVAEFDEPRGVVAVAWPFEITSAPSVERGGEEPPGAFEEAFGPAFMEGFKARSINERLSLEARIQPPTIEETITTTESTALPDALGYGAGAVAFGAAAASIWQATVATKVYEKYEETLNMPETRQVRGRVQSRSYPRDRAGSHRGRHCGRIRAAVLALGLASSIPNRQSLALTCTSSHEALWPCSCSSSRPHGRSARLRGILL